jgi:STE24 endopeptidase
MTAQTIFYIIIGLFVGEFILSRFIDYLNTKNWSDKLPEELKEIYDEEKYSKSMDYEKTKFKFSMITSFFSFFVMLLVLIF